MNIAIPTQNIAALASLDQTLAEHPFGNSDYITERLHACYQRRLAKLSAHLPAAGQLLDVLNEADACARHRVIGDTVVRCAVQHALKQVETGATYGLPLAHCDKLFQATISHVKACESGPLGDGSVSRLGPEAHHGWIWCGDHSDVVFAHAFQYVIHRIYGGLPCRPNTEEIAMLTRGVRLLEELLPHSSRSALSHAYTIAIFPRDGALKKIASSSDFRLGGTVFLSRKFLSNPWWVAEHLFHEALHQQLYDFRHGHSLLVPAFDKEESRIHSLWNLPGGNYWDIPRALAAFHVYVYLALFGALAEHRAPALEHSYGALNGPISVTGSRKSLQRARYLAEEIRAVCWQKLGPAGKRFVDFFSAVLDFLDLSPAPPGSFIHLLLDRYQKEAMIVDSLLKKANRRFELSQQIIMLAEDEVATTQNVLATVNAELHLNRFNSSIARLTKEELGTKFAWTRSFIAKSILGASCDGFRMSKDHVADETVKAMIERSSERLKILLNAQSG
jgi:hypothetical protein